MPPPYASCSGLVHYRLGQYPAASRELGAFADLTGSVEQHPVLMDCARAQKKYAVVASLWEELAASSPSAALVSEGRIVMAGSLADRGRLRDAVAMLERRGGNVQRPAEHHLRVWYALADLCERTGDLPRARELFDRVRRRDPAFADVAERLLASADAGQPRRCRTPSVRSGQFLLSVRTRVARPV